MKHIPLAIALVFFFGMNEVFAQRYGTAVGMRLGTDWGLTVQQRLTKRITIEGIAQSSLQREEVLLTGLIQKHNPILGRRLNLYLGGGLHKGWINAPADQETGAVPEDPFGVTLVGGIEFSLGRINVGYDLKPAINIRGGEQNFYTQSGISLRYVLIKDKEWRKKQRKRKREKKRERRRKRRRN